MHFPPDAARWLLRVVEGHKARGAGLLARVVPLVELGGFPAEQDGTASLPEAQDYDGHEHGKRDCVRPKDPTPTDVLRDETAEERPETGAEDCAAGEDRHGRVTVLLFVDVRDDAADHGREGGAPAAGDEARNEHAGIVLCGSTASHTYDIYDTRDDEDRSAAVDLGERSSDGVRMVRVVGAERGPVPRTMGATPKPAVKIDIPTSMAT